MQKYLLFLFFRYFCIMNDLEFHFSSIIDSQMTFEEAIAGSKAPKKIIDQLMLIDVDYFSTDALQHRGQILLNRCISDDIIAIFQIIKEIKFPIHRAIPIVAYQWDDQQSMAANNTSAFCYRKVITSGNLSKHAYGKAIDINPFFNPVIWKEPFTQRPVMPKGATYDVTQPGTLYTNHPVVQELIKRKFTWGYHFQTYHDIHHFHRDW